MDVDKQTAYWRDSGIDDMDAARILFEQGKLRHGLFFAHLALEKTLKAHVVRTAGTHPPKLHNLVSLAKGSGLEFSVDSMEFLSVFDVHQLQGRYPDKAEDPLDAVEAQKDFAQAQEMQQWLLNRL